MPLPTIPSGNVASATAAVYEVANSCRFNDDDSPSMYKTPGSGGNQTTWTFSTWFKRGNISTSQWIFDAFDGAGDEFHILINSGNAISIYTIGGGFGDNLTITSSNLVKDCSAWYHLVVRCDTTQGTASDRLRVYLNGAEVTYSTYNNFTQNGAGQVSESGTKHWIGRRNAGDYLDGYLAETVLVDGSSLAPTSFGEFNSDSPTIWQPIDVSGLTFGTNGFYLDYEDSSNLGNDANGGTDFTEANLAAADQATDTPTNNFCTLNPLIKWYAASTMSEGSMKVVESSGGWGGTKGTMAVSKGKWYWEVKLSGTIANHLHGVQAINTEGAATINPQNFDGSSMYLNGDGGEVKVYQSGGGVTTTADYGTLDSGDILGIALNMDGGSYGQITFYDQNSALVSNFDMSSDNPEYVAPFGAFLSSTAEYNFGGCSAFALTSAANDENGYGNFEFAPPSGYLALCTKNLGSDG